MFCHLRPVLSITVIGLLAACAPTDAEHVSYSVIGCSNEGACPAETRCVSDLCLSACASDSDCPASAVCLDGSCFAARGESCVGNDECDQGICATNICGVLPSTLGCVQDADCGAGTSCHHGACVAVVSCDTAETCGNDIDDDCDGLIDEECESACTAEICGNDIDENCDGIIDECQECSSTAECPSGMACSSGTCEFSPGVCDSAEICGNDIDDDCNGLIDEEC